LSTWNMDVVPHRSAPTIMKPGIIRAPWMGRPAVIMPQRAAFLASTCQPVWAGCATRPSTAQARGRLPTEVCWLWLMKSVLLLVPAKRAAEKLGKLFVVRSVVIGKHAPGLGRHRRAGTGVVLAEAVGRLEGVQAKERQQPP